MEFRAAQGLEGLVTSVFRFAGLVGSCGPAQVIEFRALEFLRACSAALITF